MKKGRRFICRGPLQPTVAAAAGRSWQVAQSTRFCPTSYSWTRVTLEVLYKHGAEKETTDRSCTCVVSIKTGSSHQIIRGSVNPLGRIALLIFIPFAEFHQFSLVFIFFLKNMVSGWYIWYQLVWDFPFFRFSVFRGVQNSFLERGQP